MNFNKNTYLLSNLIQLTTQVQRALFCALLSLTSAGVWAETNLSALNEKLIKLYPKTQFKSVAVSAMPGLFEVQMGKNIAYVDASGQYFLFGHLFDMKIQKDLTAQMLEKMNAIDVKSLPTQDAIKTVKGDGARVVYVFADPECGFCKKQEEILQKVENVTVYTFILPILGPNSVSQATAIWCAKDRAKAWENKMVRNLNVPKPAKTCDTPIERNLALAQQLGIQGTPYLIAASGKTASGALSLEKTEEFLDSNAADKE
jgi:thiol:disulfide interchange protein DsbC